jgi:hypothetical protein
VLVFTWRDTIRPRRACSGLGAVEQFFLPTATYPEEIEALLFSRWVQCYASDRFSITQSGGSGRTPEGKELFNFGSPPSKSFSLERAFDGCWTMKNTNGVTESEVESGIASALERVSSRDFGGEVVYKTTLKSNAFSMTHSDMAHGSAKTRRIGVY